MTVREFIDGVRERYRTQPVVQATRGTVHDVRLGVCRRLGPRIGRPIWDRGDWDMLVILDGCRADLWDDVAPEYGLATGDTVWSNAACSIDWIRRNLAAHPDELARAGYVTANPFADHDAADAQSAGLGSMDVGHFRPLYRTHWSELFDGQIATVPPDVVTDHAIDAWRERETLGIDRLIVHYMQPHEPYRARPEWGSGDHKLLSDLTTEGGTAGRSVWPRIEAGEILADEFWGVYKDNLRWVLDDVTERLLTNCDARIVLSADHGNGLGEWGEWHHPPGAIGPGVRRVPWVRVDGTDVRDVNPGVDVWTTGTQTDDNADGDATRDQLRALGYR